MKSLPSLILRAAAVIVLTGSLEGNRLQSMPDKGWSVILRLYGPLHPWFDKTWRPSEIEEVK